MTKEQCAICTTKQTENRTKKYQTKKQLKQEKTLNQDTT